MGRSPYRCFIPALVSLAACACAADADTVLDVTYDPCTARIAAADSATDEEIASLDAALALWNERGAFRLSRAARADTEPPAALGSVLVVRFQKEFPAFAGFYDDEAGEIIVNRGLRDPARVVAIAHELGHAFGLWHVERSERRSVMNPGNTKIEPLPPDIAAVRALWGSCE